MNRLSFIRSILAALVAALAPSRPTEADEYLFVRHGVLKTRCFECTGEHPISSYDTWDADEGDTPTPITAEWEFNFDCPSNGGRVRLIIESDKELPHIHLVPHRMHNGHPVKRGCRIGTDADSHVERIGGVFWAVPGPFPGV